MLNIKNHLRFHFVNTYRQKVQIPEEKEVHVE